MTTRIVSTSPAQQAQVHYRRLAWVGPLAVVVAIIGNSLVYALAKAFGAFPSELLIPAAGQPLTLAPVVVATAVGVLSSVAVYAIIGRLTRRPVLVFRIIATIVLVLSFATPFTVPGGSSLFYAALLAMHLLAGLVAIMLLTTFARTQHQKDVS